ncbi:hypothetical protein PENANT_c116G05132 [Penicillium antarcticum]|uniref:Xylanolytic transcriptional activator regulatory domain-containing protein n=1 Tax=Penicillium antarcticum TaxID=416450 RepID=A0A1V6PJS0_9EURO|nr:hypothetical protein PENANT_c116G05132 [Penicillium antarcticum]
MPKIKCDGTHPRCDWCRHHSVPCTYTRNKEAVSLGSRKVQEQKLKETSNTPLSETSPPVKKGSGNDSTPEVFYTPPGVIPVVPQAIGSDLCFESQSLGNICGFNGLPFFSSAGLSWIKDRTGDGASIGWYSAGAPHVWPPTETKEEYGNRKLVELPDKKVLRQLLEAYQKSIHGQLFPLVNPPCFEHTIRAAYEEQLSDISPSAVCARGCVFGFMAMASYMTASPREDAIMSADKNAREVQDLLQDISREPVTLDGLQAVVMLCFCCTALSGDVFKLELFLSLAVRYVFHLKGNLYPTVVNDKYAHAKLHVRNLFWICFIQDKFFGLRTGLPPLFDPTNCDLTLPGCEHPHSDPRSSKSSRQQNPSAFITLIRLCIVQSEIYRGLYSCSALQQSDAELLATIRRLDSALEEWWSFLGTSPQLLGRFLTPCFSELMTSTIHLFSNILTNPLDRTSWTDLELMRATSRHVENHMWQQAPASFAAQVRLIERFMGDLQRLAECAIVKAQRERKGDRVVTEE